MTLLEIINNEITETKTNEMGPTAVETYNKIKNFPLRALLGFGRRIGLPQEVLRPLGRTNDTESLIDEIMGFLHGDDWERALMRARVL